jgi:hypothetical protein
MIVFDRVKLDEREIIISWLDTLYLADENLESSWHSFLLRD